jgi:hypothetical protein
MAAVVAALFRGEFGASDLERSQVLEYHVQNRIDLFCVVDIDLDLDLDIVDLLVIAFDVGFFGLIELLAIVIDVGLTDPDPRGSRTSKVHFAPGAADCSKLVDCHKLATAVAHEHSRTLRAVLASCSIVAQAASHRIAALDRLCA